MTDEVIRVDFRPAMSDDRVADYVVELSALLGGMQEEHATVSQLMTALLGALQLALQPDQGDGERS